MEFKPHPYQVQAIRRILDEQAVGLFMDMGLGKTVVTLTAIDELIYDRLKVSRVLVIAPLKVAEATWQAEAEKWDHLKRLRFSAALGSADQRARAVEEPADVTIINRENVAWLVESFGARWPFDMIVVDESSSFKNPGAKRFKALRKVLPKVSRVVILTGTPAPNGLEDLWSQIFLLDRGERLGRYITHYRERYFDFNPWKHAYIPKAGAFDTVREKIGDICVSMKAEDYLQLPELIIHDMPVVLSGQGLKAYRELEKTMVLTVSEDEEISAVTAAALTGKLLQLCGGSVYTEAGDVVHVHDAKLEALSELLEGVREPVLLFYGFRHELPGLVDACKGRRVRQLQSAEDAAAWNRGEVDVLIAHPASCAYGLNLQAGGRQVVWFTLTWSLELYQQANARLYRQGQTKPVIIHRLLAKDGVDEDVAYALENKTDSQDQLLEALKVRIRKARV